MRLVPARLCLFLGLLSIVACGDDDPAGGPQINVFSADVTSVPAGTPVTLRWNTSGATRVRVTVAGDNVNTLADSANAAGSVVTPPLTAATTYVLTASADGAVATAELTVEVEGAGGPSIDVFTADPATILFGDSTTLSWSASNTRSVGITTGLGATVLGDEAPTGSFQVSPTVDTDYILTAMGTDGRIVARRITVTVDFAPGDRPNIVQFEASETVVMSGETIDLRWNVEGLQPMTVRILRTGSVRFQTSEVMGTRTITPINATYVLEAVNVAGTATATVDITVNLPPPAEIVRFEASPGDIVAGEQAILTWQTQRADRVTVEAGGQTLLDTDTETQLAVQPLQTTTYTLTAFSPNGDATADVQVNVTVIQPVVDAFTASATVVPAGSDTTLAWATRDADRVRILRGGDVVVDSMEASGMATASVPAGRTTFALEASNAGAQTTETVDVVGVAAAPVIEAFSVTPAQVTASSSITVAWTVDAVSELTLTRDGAAVAGFTGVTTSSVTRTSGMLTLSSTVGTFVLTARNVVGEVTATQRVTRIVDDIEPNGTATTAQSLPAGGGLARGEITAGDDDVYAVAVDEGGSLFAEVDDGAGGCPFDAVLTVLGSDGQTVLAVNDNGGVGACPRIDPRNQAGVQDLATGVYFVQVSALMGATGSYTLEVRAEAPACGNGLRETRAGEQCDDANTSGADGCSPTCALQAELTFSAPGPRTSLSASIDPATDIEVVQVTVTSTAYLAAETVTASCAQTDTLLSLYDDQGTLIGEDDASGDGSCSRIDPMVDGWARLGPGVYWLTVTEDGGDAVLPSIDLQVEGIAADECGNGVREAGEACDDGNMTGGDGCSAMCLLEPRGTYTAPAGPAVVPVSLTTVGDVAAIAITVTSTAFVSVETFSDASAGQCLIDTQLELRSDAGMTLATDDDGGVAPCAALTNRLLSPGAYAAVITATTTAFDVALSSAPVPMPMGAVAEIEPNDTATTAQSVTVASGQWATVTATLTAADSDTVSFTVSATTSAILVTHGVAGALDSCATDTALTLRSGGVALATDDNGGFGTCARIDRRLGPGTYTLDVRSIAGAVGAYLLSIILL